MAGGDGRSVNHLVVEIQLAPVGGRFGCAMTSQILKDHDGAGGAPGDMGASNRGVRAEDGHAGRGAQSNWLGEEIELLICSAGGCVTVLMFLCVCEREDD